MKRSTSANQLIALLGESNFEKPVHFEEIVGCTVLNHVVEMSYFLLAHPVYQLLLLHIEVHVHILQKVCI